MPKPIQLDTGFVYWHESNDPPRTLAQANAIERYRQAVAECFEPEPHLWYIEDDNGYCGLSYLSGPDRGRPASYPSREEAEKAIDYLGLDRGIFRVTDVEPILNAGL